MRQRDNAEKRRESGLPGGGAGRKDEVAGSGVYPMSGPHPSGNAPIMTPGTWGQGQRGAAGYEDHGESELNIPGVTPEKCRDIMTKDPVCCLSSDPISAAAELMRKHDVGVLPVVLSQRNKRLVGIITDRDLVLRIVADERDPHRSTMDEIMTRPVVTCSPDDEYQKALELMERNQLRRIPQIDNSGRVVGIISQGDIALSVHDQAKTAEMITEISRPTWHSQTLQE
jgi:CBS domain-containing protein